MKYTEKTDEQKAAQKIYRAKWNKANKDKIAAQNKRFRESVNPNYYRKYTPEYGNDGFWTVYKLSSGYIGQTCNLYSRMANHKSRYGRDINGHTVLATCYTKQEALDLEALYQSLSDTYDSMDNKSRIISL